MDAEENPFNDGAPVEPPVDFKSARRQKQGLADPTHAGREPPHSAEAEQGVLGCIFLSPKECIPDCIDSFKDHSDVFYDLRHRTVYETLVEMYDNQQAIDIITVQQVLRDRKQLDTVGGVAYLASLPDTVPSAANLGYYTDIVKEKAVLRRAISVCTDSIAMAYDGLAAGVEDFLDKLAHNVNKLVAPTSGTGLRSAKQLVPLANETMDRLYQKKEATVGLSTGFPELDNMTLGLHPGQVFVIAARPSVGKSSIAMNIADYIVVEKKLPVGVFSLEMPAEDLMLRMICSRAEVDLRSVMVGDLAKEQFDKLGNASTQLIKVPLYIDDSRGLSILQAKAKARQMVQQYGIKLFIFDYLQLMHSTSHRVQNRDQEVGDVSQGIKELSGELDVPIILVAQLNREVERQGGRRPRLSDLRESGRIEQDADSVGFLYRTTDQSDNDYWANKSDVVPVNLLIAKQRNGPTGEIPLVFHRSYTRFESATTQNQKNNDPTENWPGENI